MGTSKLLGKPNKLRGNDLRWTSIPSRGSRNTFPQQIAGTHLYSWVERGTVRVKCLTQNTTQCPRPGLEPGPIAPGTGALTMRPPVCWEWEVQSTMETAEHWLCTYVIILGISYLLSSARQQRKMTKFCIVWRT